jgi:hypothetical protein
MSMRTAAIIVLFSVLLVFFVPASVGPFSAVYGPATALRANRAAQVFYITLALSARYPISAVTLATVLASVSLHSLVLELDDPNLLCALRC